MSDYRMVPGQGQNIDRVGMFGEESTEESEADISGACVAPELRDGVPEGTLYALNQC